MKQIPSKLAKWYFPKSEHESLDVVDLSLDTDNLWLLRDEDTSINIGIYKKNYSLINWDKDVNHTFVRFVPMWFIENGVDPMKMKEFLGLSDRFSVCKSRDGYKVSDDGEYKGSLNIEDGVVQYIVKGLVVNEINLKELYYENI